MPEPAAEVPESGSWRALVELTKETVRPGRGDNAKPASDRPVRGEPELPSTVTDGTVHIEDAPCVGQLLG